MPSAAREVTPGWVRYKFYDPTIRAIGAERSWTFPIASLLQGDFIEYALVVPVAEYVGPDLSRVTFKLFAGRDTLLQGELYPAPELNFHLAAAKHVMFFADSDVDLELEVSTNGCDFGDITAGGFWLLMKTQVLPT